MASPNGNPYSSNWFSIPRLISKDRYIPLRKAGLPLYLSITHSYRESWAASERVDHSPESLEITRSQADQKVEIYRKKPSSSTTLLASVQRIINDLSIWAKRLPDRLRLDLNTLETSINREYITIFLHFYYCINMTVRPLVFNIVQRRLEAGISGSADWRQMVSRSLVTVIEACISAARVTIWVMRAAIQRNLFGTYVRL